MLSGTTLSTPFTGATAIDVDGDGRDEVFIGGGLNQADRLYAWRDGALVNIEPGSNLSSLDATHGVMSLDMDTDGDVDLILARASGVYLYLNDGSGTFEEQVIEVKKSACRVRAVSGSGHRL